MQIMILVVSGLITYFIMPFIHNMLLEANIVGKNYKGDMIPVGMGMTYVPVILLNFLVIHYFFYNLNKTFLVFLIGILTMAFVGLIDDLIGNRSTLGFKGHIRSLFQGKLTTGGLKAVVGGLISILISANITPSYIEMIINVLLITLMTNLLNLFDLRPGRAIKFYLLVAIIFLIIGVTLESTYILLLTIGYCILYLPQDLKAKSMMGDVGSNSLGMSLGIVAALSFSLEVKSILVGFLIIIHIIAEKYSLTKIIQKNAVLNYLDELGRLKS